MRVSNPCLCLHAAFRAHDSSCVCLAMCARGIPSRTFLPATLAIVYIQLALRREEALALLAIVFAHLVIRVSRRQGGP